MSEQKKDTLMYVLDYNQQLSMINEMTQLRKDLDNWVVYYHNPSTNEMWKSFFPKSNGQKRGPKILRTEPVAEDLETRINRCLMSSVEENAMGLGIELSVNPSKWDRILTILENNYRAYDRSQLKKFVDYLGVLNPGELLGEIDHKPEDFGLNEEQLNKMRWRARKIRFKRFWSLA